MSFTEALFDNMFNRKTVDEVLADQENAFLITRKDKHIKNMRKFVTTDSEAIID